MKRYTNKNSKLNIQLKFLYKKKFKIVAISIKKKSFDIVAIFFLIL